MQIPDGVKPGQGFAIMANGQQMQVTAPPGASSGQTITISVPAPMAVAVAVPISATPVVPASVVQPMPAAPVHQGGGNRGHCCDASCCFCTFMILAILAALAGAGFFAGGTAISSATSERDASVDFEPIEGGCKVVDWSDFKQTRDRDDGEKCMQTFEYEFCVRNATGWACGLYSKLSEREACATRSCSECGTTLQPEFRRDSLTPCWQPAPGYEAVYDALPYDCGREVDGCIKIFDPAVELAALRVVLVILFVWGTICCFACCVCGCISACCRHKQIQLSRPPQAPDSSATHALGGL